MITVNGLPVLELRLSLPVQGVWVASLEAVTEERLEGAVEIEQDGAPPFSGTIVKPSDPVSGSCRVDVVGGKGAIRGRALASRSFLGVTARAVAEDTLAGLGEALAPTSSKSLLGTSLAYWTRAAATPPFGSGAELSRLVDALGGRWRVLPDGTVWLGTETWPDAPEDYQAIELDRDDAAGRVLLAPDTIGLTPGVTYEGRRVGRVEHTVGRRQPLRTTFWVDS